MSRFPAWGCGQAQVEQELSQPSQGPGSAQGRPAPARGVCVNFSRAELRRHVAGARLREGITATKKAGQSERL
jgi:hypothetical protein